MSLERSIWMSILLPALLCAVPVAGCAYVVLGSLSAAIFILGACLSCTIAHGLMAVRNARDASAQLRRPELRGEKARSTGIYGPLLAEALSLVERIERDAQAAIQAKTELEARTSVRQHQLRLLESSLACLDRPLLVANPRDELLFCNPAAVELFRRLGGGSQFDSRQGPDLNAVPGLKPLLEQTRTRKGGADSRTAELEVSLAGEIATYRATATSIYEDQRRLLGVVVVLSDIRDERREKTRHAEFVSSVCHELKTPMASIRAYTEMLIDGDVSDPVEQQELFGFIELQVDRLTRLVNNMLNLARIESGVVKIHREDCELNEILHGAADVVEQLAREKRQTLTLELSDLYLAVHVDPELLGQAVINLLSNAVKYTPAGGEIRLKSRMEEGWAKIEVRDNGMGIPADSLPRIFERFYRVPENNAAAAGTGLGLSLVHHLVTELHNGQISVASEVGQGTTFTLSIPLGHRDQNRRKQESPPLLATRNE